MGQILLKILGIKWFTKLFFRLADRSLCYTFIFKSAWRESPFSLAELWEPSGGCLPSPDGICCAVVHSAGPFGYLLSGKRSGCAQPLGQEAKASVLDSAGPLAAPVWVVVLSSRTSRYLGQQSC